MPAYTNPTAEPRAELSAVVVQGRGMNKANIWQDVLPSYPVTHRTGHLVNLSIAQANTMRIMDKIMRPGTNLERRNMTVGDQSYTIDLRGEEVVIPDEVEMTYEDYFSIEAQASQNTEDALELTHEYLTAAAIFSTATFGAATNSLVAYTVANAATNSFIADIIAATQRGRAKGEIYNTIVIPFLVLQRVMQSAAVLAFVRGTTNPQAEVNQSTILAALKEWGIEKILIGNALYNNAAEGATPSLVEIWANTYIWVGTTSSTATGSEDGIETIEGVGASLFWDKYGMQNIDTYRDEPRRSNVVRGTTSLIPYIANSNSGTLIATQYA